jgi:transcriptional regulator with XRE-family HTH domain
MKLNISKIESYLESKKITNKAFSAQIGMSEVGWNLLKKRGSTSYETLVKIADAMSVDKDSILSGYIEPSKSVATKQFERNLKITPISEFLCARLYEFMKTNKLTQLELSQLIGIHDRTLTYQLSNNAITVATLGAISQLFTDVNINWFFRENVPFLLSAGMSMVAEPGIAYSSNPLSQINDRLKNIELLLKPK